MPLSESIAQSLYLLPRKHVLKLRRKFKICAKSTRGGVREVNWIYKSVVVECSTGVEDMAKAIADKAEEMLNKSYKLVTMSMVGEEKAILVFKV